ncbi:MAG: sugar phosphate isomerase/epimerase family protein [Candidatus Bathyarchaeia archaeon]
MNPIAMKMAVSTLFCMNKSLEEAYQDIIMLGVKHVELTDEGFHSLTIPRVERLLELKSSYDLQYSVHAPFSDVNIAAFDNTIREAVLRRIENSIKLSSSLEVRAFVLHPGAYTVLEHFTPGESWRRYLESLKRLLMYSSEYGVPMMIENVPEPHPFLMKSVEDFKRFFEETQFEVEMVLDIAHANLRGEVKDFLESLKDRIGHIHVSDNHGKFDEHLQIGEGGINWSEVMRLIRQAGFKGWIVIESFKGVEESIRLLEDLSS